jgi:hypothetical protein
VTHLSREELERWWAEGRPEERERVVGHLAVCDDCGALYGDIIDARDLATTKLTAEPPPGLAARAYRAYRPRRSGLSSLPFVWGAAAAALLVALGIVALRAPAPPGDPGGIRGTSLLPLSPIGRVDPPVEFKWESPVRASRYRIEVEDAEGRPWFVLFSEGESAALPRERLEELEPGKEYWWEVVALGPQGEEIMGAERRPFFLSSGPR